MTDTGKKQTTQPAYWFVVAVVFIIAGIVILITGHLPWLGVIALVAGVLWAGLGLRAARRR